MNFFNPFFMNKPIKKDDGEDRSTPPPSKADKFTKNVMLEN